jgi:hypothetical protein
LEGSMEPPDRIRKNTRVVVDRCSNQRMGKLEQQGAARAHKDCRLAVEPPLHGIATEDPLKRSSRTGLDYPKLVLELLSRDYVH